MRPYGYLNRQYSVRHIRRTSPGSFDDMAAYDPLKGCERNNNKQIINNQLYELQEIEHE